jgi:hypothetical protein
VPASLTFRLLLAIILVNLLQVGIAGLSVCDQGSLTPFVSLAVSWRRSGTWWGPEGTSNSPGRRGVRLKPALRVDRYDGFVFP